MPIDYFTWTDTATIETQTFILGLGFYRSWCLWEGSTERACMLHVNINPLLLGDLEVFNSPELSPAPGTWSYTAEALKTGTLVGIPIATLKEL